MLTDGQIEELAPRMGIPLKWIGFKSELPRKLYPNMSYIVNLEDAVDKDGKGNLGSHWTCFQVREYPNKTLQAVYFDSYGVGAPKIVCDTIANNFGCGVYHTNKDIQSLMSEVCGYYCLAFLHFINECPQRTGEIVQDTEIFMSMFDDLDTVYDFKRNEYTLKHFFLAKDPKIRKSVEIINDDIKETMEALKTQTMEAKM